MHSLVRISLLLLSSGGSPEIPEAVETGGDPQSEARGGARPMEAPPAELPERSSHPPAEPARGGGSAAEASPEAYSAPSPPLIAARDLRLRFKLLERGAAGIERLFLHWTEDGGQSWSTSAVEAQGTAILFHAPRDGRFGFALSASDAAGARVPPPAAGTVPDQEVIVDTVGPRIRVVRPDRLEVVGPDRRFEIEWEVQDDHLTQPPLEIAASLNGGPWEMIRRDAPARGVHRWKTPLVPGEVKLRFRARDLAGNLTEVITPAVCAVRTGRGGNARWIGAPAHSRSRRVPIHYRLSRDPEAGGEGLAPGELLRIQVWYRSNALEWTKGETDPDRRSPVDFLAQTDGWYDLLLVAQDRDGRSIPAEAAPGPDGKPDRNLEPHARFLIDTRAPRVRLIEPADGAWIDAAQPLAIRYRVEEENPRAEGVKILASLDGGAGWTLLASGLEPEPREGGGVFQGEFRFQLPAIECERFLLKVVAADQVGNEGEGSTAPEKPITIRNPRSDPALKAEEHYQRGVALLRSSEPGDRQRSLESFRRALAYRGDYAAAHHDLAAAIESTRAPSGGGPSDPAADEALAHYRQALEAAPEEPRYAFKLVDALIRRAEAAGGEAGKVYLLEAERVFQRISWTRLVELAAVDTEEYQRYRKQYRTWKDLYFNRIPR